MAIEDYYTDITLESVTENFDAKGGVITSDVETTFRGRVTHASSRDLEVANKLQIQATHTLYCPVTVDLSYVNTIKDGDAVYQIVSDPQNTVGRDHHYKVILRRVIDG